MCVSCWEIISKKRLFFSCLHINGMTVMTTDNQLVFFFIHKYVIEINYFVSAVQNAAVYERVLYVVFLGKVFFLLWKTEEFIKLVDLESTRILEVDEKVTSP